jgi:hypothetical protein
VKNRCASILVVGLTLGLNDSAYAQAAGGRIVNVDAGRTSFAAVQQYSQADRFRSEQLEVPGNISVAPEYRLKLEMMLANSASFRRQCVRIANEPSLTVHLQHVPVRLGGGVRGISHISRSPAGRIVAHVTLPHVTLTLRPFDDDIEMIAHEFEHVIEQLDGVDLAMKARRADSGVRTSDVAGSMFETRRALQVGLRVLEEVRQSTHEGS